MIKTVSVVCGPVKKSQTEMDHHSIIRCHRHPHLSAQKTKTKTISAFVALHAILCFNDDPSIKCSCLLPSSSDQSVQRQIVPTGGSKKERCCGLLSGGDAHSEWPSDLANIDVSRGHCRERLLNQASLHEHYPSDSTAAM